MKNRRKQGQGMTEYIIIVVLIAIALIALVKAYGGELKNLIEGSSTETNDSVGGEIGANPGGPTAGNGGDNDGGGGPSSGNNDGGG